MRLERSISAFALRVKSFMFLSNLLRSSWRLYSARKPVRSLGLSFGLAMPVAMIEAAKPPNTAPLLLPSWYIVSAYGCNELSDASKEMKAAAAV